MHEIAPLIKDLTIIMCVAGFVTIFFQWIKQPVVLGYLVAGLLIGPHTPPTDFISDTADVQTLAELGVIFLMFSLGLEFSFHKLKQAGGAALIIAVIEVLLMMVIGYWLGEFLGWSTKSSMFLGAALAISSTTIIIKAISDLGMKQQTFTRLIFAVLIVEDLLAILLLVFLSTSNSQNSLFSYDLIGHLTKLIIVIGGWFLIGYFIIPLLVRRVAGVVSNETLTIVAIGLCLLLVYAAAYSHYSVALGAFMMGSILAETPLGSRIENLVQPIRDVFAAVFFVTVGMLIDPEIIMSNWQVILILALVTIFGKLMSSAFGAIVAGRDIKSSLQVGLGMAQIGEFSFIIISLGMSLNIVSENLYSIIVAVSVLTTFTTPYGIRWSDSLSANVAAFFPAKVHQWLKNYAQKWIGLSSKANIHISWKIAIARFLVNTLVVAIFFSISAEVISHFSEHLSHAWLIIIWTITMIVASPFLWAILFAFREIQTQTRLVILMMLGTWLLALIEISLLSDIYFENWLSVFYSIAISIFVIMLSRRHLSKIYKRFAKQLVANLEAGKKHSQDG